MPTTALATSVWYAASTAAPMMPLTMSDDESEPSTSEAVCCANLAIDARPPVIMTIPPIRPSTPVASASQVAAASVAGRLSGPAAGPPATGMAGRPTDPW